MKKTKERWSDKKRYVEDDWGCSHETTNGHWLVHDIILPTVASLVLITVVVVLTIAALTTHRQYDAAVIVGDTTSNIIHIDHYEDRGNRYVIYDKDGRVYEADCELVVFYNYDDKE